MIKIYLFISSLLLNMTQKIPFLFSFETLSLAFVPTVDPNLHIIVDQPNPETSRVIKNGHKVKKMF